MYLNKACEHSGSWFPSFFSFFLGGCVSCNVVFQMRLLFISHEVLFASSLFSNPLSLLIKMFFDTTYHGPLDNGEGRPRDVITELRDEELRTTSNRSGTRSRTVGTHPNVTTSANSASIPTPARSTLLPPTPPNLRTVVQYLRNRST